jgi:hypothetical protein
MTRQKAHRNTGAQCMVFSLMMCCLPAGWLSAQNYQMPLERRITESIENHHSAVDTFMHTAMKPFHARSVQRDSVPRINNRDKRYFSTTEASLFGTHMFEVREDDFTFLVDVVLDLELGFEFSDSTGWGTGSNLYNNTRGVAAYGTIGDRVSFHATVFENQSRFPYFLHAYGDSLQVVPGQGRFKENFAGTRDYNSATGVVSVRATPWLDVHFGHGKHFIGHGYRSMLLSDVAFNYPYLRLQAESPNRKWQYTTTTAELNSLERLPLGDVPESLFQRKGFAFKYLSYFPHSRVELGLFEATTFQRWDSTGTQRYPVTFFQPLPLVNAAVIGFNDVHKNILGLNAKLKLTDHVHLYGQYVLDRSESGFNGFQVGLFANHLLKNLSLRLEHNEGGAGLFSHPLPLQNYSHMNQPMAHPLGMAFSEQVIILQHHKNRFWSEWRGFHQRNSAGNHGNISAPTEVALLADARPQTTLISDLRIGYTVNPTSNSHAIIGWMWRDRSNDAGHFVTSYYYVAFRVSVFNRYYDI